MFLRFSKARVRDLLLQGRRSASAPSCSHRVLRPPPTRHRLPPPQLEIQVDSLDEVKDRNPVAYGTDDRVAIRGEADVGLTVVDGAGEVGESEGAGGGSAVERAGG